MIALSTRPALWRPDVVLRTDVRILLSVFLFDVAIVLYLDQFTRGPSRLKLSPWTIRVAHPPTVSGLQLLGRHVRLVAFFGKAVGDEAMASDPEQDR
jgi:hypothetical protein